MGNSRCPINPSADEAAAAVSRAVMRAAGRLQLDHATLAEILGISESAAASLASGSYLLQPSRKREWEFALLLLRLFRSLDVTLGHGRQARLWLRANNRALAGRPVDLIKSAEGMIRVLHYVDAERGRS